MTDLDLFGNLSVPPVVREHKKPMGRIQAFRARHNYRKSADAIKRCEFCVSLHAQGHDRTYYKCKRQSTGRSESSDIRKSYVCDLWEPEA